MDISYLKNNYNLILQCSSNITASGLLYSDNITQEMYIVEHLSKDKIVRIKNLILSLSDRNNYNPRLFQKLNKSLNYLIEAKKECFAPVFHKIPNKNCNLIRIIFGNCQITMTENFDNIVDLYYPNNKVSYKKFKKNKKKYKKHKDSSSN